MRIAGIAAAFAAGVSTLAAPAGAVDDLTGVYTAKVSCKNIDSGTVEPFKSEEQFLVVDEGTGFVRFQTMGRGPGRAFLETVTAKPDLGVLSGMTCTTGVATFDGLVIHLDVNSKPADPKLKGTLLLFNDPGSQSASCKFSAKRTAPGPLKIADCG